MRERNTRGSFVQMIAFAAVAVLGMLVFANQLARKSLFVARPSSYQESSSLLKIPSEDGTELVAFWGPTPGAKRTVFYFHGNAEDLGDVMPFLNNYRLRGFNVICFDYRGYGLTPGKSTEKKSYADAEAVFEYLENTLKTPAASVILHGRSLGGGVATDLATRKEVAGLILESAFRSVFKVFLSIEWLPGDKFRNESKMEDVKCPVLLIHGMEDEVVPFDHGVVLADSLGEGRVKTLWVETAGHNDLRAIAGEAYWQAIRGFALEATQ